MKDEHLHIVAARETLSTSHSRLGVDALRPERSKPPVTTRPMRMPHQASHEGER